MILIFFLSNLMNPKKAQPLLDGFTFPGPEKLEDMARFLL
jgi:hypothetical protein